jgi:hypothetical protein
MDSTEFRLSRPLPGLHSLTSPYPALSSEPEKKLVSRKSTILFSPALREHAAGHSTSSERSVTRLPFGMPASIEVYTRTTVIYFRFYA